MPTKTTTTLDLRIGILKIITTELSNINQCIDTEVPVDQKDLYERMLDNVDKIHALSEEIRELVLGNIARLSF